MNGVGFTSTFVVAPVMALVGLACGLLYFRTLRWTVDVIVGGRDWQAAAALTLARIAGVIVVLATITQLGPIPLLACFLGFLVARAVALRTVQGAG